MARIRQTDRDAIMNALAAGVTPRRGIQHIQVGRKEETEALLRDIRAIESGGSSCRIIDASYGGGKTFMMTLVKTIALKRNLLVMQCDLSPDRRLYSSTGKARALYQELVRSLSSMTSPDGGALQELLDSLDDRISLDDAAFLGEVRRLPYGFDAVTVIARWHQARNPVTEAERRDAPLLQDACLRWFAAENTVEHKRMLGVKASIGDGGAYDALKLIGVLAHHAGFGGLLVELDECVNLYKINDSSSRDRNFEQILRMINECRQGDSAYVGFILAGTPEFVMDPRRGLYSYEALKSRLVASRYSDGATVDAEAPIIDLKPMPQESLFVMLRNVVTVDSLGVEADRVMSDEDIEAFLGRCYETLGAEFYRTPREVIRDFVALVRALHASPDATPADVIAAASVSGGRRPSGMSRVSEPATKVTFAAPAADASSSPSAGDGEEFGF